MEQLELGYEPEQSSVEPEVRACVSSLVSALGGPSAIENGCYVLGDDALAVLKDIKRWLKLWDEKTGRLDVARTLAESNLVRGDLLEILAQWPEDATESSFMSKIALLCIDLLTILTWPINTEDEHLQKVYRFKHLPTIQRAHASYKQAILHHDIIKVLRTSIRVALPAMAQTQKERSTMEDNIIKVVLYLFRNIAMITEPEDFVPDDYQSDISRSSTIDAFHYQDIFSLMLTICSGMTDEFRNHDVEILETVFYLVKGIDVERLFMEKDELIQANASELKSLHSKEKHMLASYARPTRHNRFGTMMWLKREGGPATTTFGQKALKSEQQALAELDHKKTWKKPSRPRKKDKLDTPTDQFDKTVPLTPKARTHLRNFVEQFLDSSFNPLMLTVRRAIEREANTITEHHKRQYFYLISWFLRAETARRKKQAQDRAKRAATSQTVISEVESYSLIAAVLNQETFVLLNRSMETAQEAKNWLDLNAAMKCFTQILLTVQDMTDSPLDEDQEIAENILNRIFYEQSTHDRIATLLRTYDNQGFGYLDACTHMAHVFCRLLENYSKQNVDMQVRSRRRARKKTAADTDAAATRRQDKEMNAEDVAEAEKTSTERKFDFAKFAAKFVNQQSINTFVSFLRFYKDFNSEQLKRAHRFFYRAAFKMEQTVYLFRLDIISLFNKLVKGPDGIDNTDPTFKDWSELVRQVFRRLVKKMQERPALAVELLFSKIPSTLYYLEHGFDREVPVKTKRAPAELELKPGLELEQQIGVVVGILINQGKVDVLAWIKKVLSDAAIERQSWLDAHDAQKSLEQNWLQRQQHPEADQPIPTTEQPEGTQELEDSTPRCPSILVTAEKPEHKKAIQDDKHVRLLLTTLSFQALESSWIIPSSLTVASLTDMNALISKFEFAPPVYDDDKSPEDFVRRKLAPRARPEKESDNNDEDSEGTSEIEGLFPPNLPDARRSSAEPGEKKSKRKRLRHKKDELLDDSVLDARREARRKKELENNRKIKSNLYVHASDDETDEEADRLFFAMEEQRRLKNHSGSGGMAEKAMALIKAAREKEAGKKAKGKGRRQSAVAEADEDEESEILSSEDETRMAKRRRSTKKKATLDTSDEDEMEKDDQTNDITSSQVASSQIQQPSQRPRARGPFLDDSDDDAPVMLSDSAAETDTPPSSAPDASKAKGKKVPDHADADADSDADADIDMERPETQGSDKENVNDDMEVDGGVAVVAEKVAVTRRRGRSGFVLDDDSDDE